MDRRQMLQSAVAAIIPGASVQAVDAKAERPKMLVVTVDKDCCGPDPASCRRLKDHLRKACREAGWGEVPVVITHGFSIDFVGVGRSSQPDLSCLVGCRCDAADKNLLRGTILAAYLACEKMEDYALQHPQCLVRWPGGKLTQEWAAALIVDVLTVKGVV